MWEGGAFRGHDNGPAFCPPVLEHPQTVVEQLVTWSLATTRLSAHELVRHLGGNIVMRWASRAAATT
jgi:hypothetical protein